MRRATVLVAVLALAFVRGQAARASGSAYAWELDPPPFGPNASAAADGSVLTLGGGGTVGEDGWARGVGAFEVADRAGNVVSAGTWRVTGQASVDDQGPIPEEVWELVAERGVVKASITLEGVGQGAITIYCAAGKTHIEGFHARVGGVSYLRIITGSSALMRSPA